MESTFVLKGKYPDSKIHGANMGPIWGRQDPGGPHVGPMNFAIWEVYVARKYCGAWCQLVHDDVMIWKRSWW